MIVFRLLSLWLFFGAFWVFISEFAIDLIRVWFIDFDGWIFTPEQISVTVGFLVVAILNAILFKFLMWAWNPETFINVKDMDGCKKNGKLS